MPTLDDYQDMVKDETCGFCGSYLSDMVSHYPHDGGWQVDGFRERQWLYLTCPKCDYDWALWKLGVPRPEI